MHGWLVTLGNHRSPDALTARVTLRLDGSAPVTARDLWGQSAVSAGRRDGEVRFSAAVPPYAFRVYRITARN